jgi:uncharacterized glyoxalase superfamily metalloenzyme YdcJ
MVLLPLSFPELPSEMQTLISGWAQDVIACWNARPAVARALPMPRPFPYPNDEETTGWFRATWGEIERRMPRLTVEIQNNCPQTPPEDQRELMEVAIWKTLEIAADMVPPR